MSYSERSSSFSRCGTPRLPVPFFLALRPHEIRSTSSIVGRQQPVAATGGVGRVVASEEVAVRTARESSQHCVALRQLRVRDCGEE